MKQGNKVLWIFFALIPFILQSCIDSERVTKPFILAAESFLADITSTIAGERFEVISLIPSDVDPHSFEPTPKDVARMNDCVLFLLNGGGLEGWIEPLLGSIDPSKIISVSDGLTPREPLTTDLVPLDDKDHHEADPHFWLDPIQVIHYVNVIQKELTRLDPDGAAIYQANAASYIQQLYELDHWISTQVDQIPPNRKLLVTNHESFGYYADRYGFKIIGAIIPSTSTSASTSAQQLAELAQKIQQNHVPAIFLEKGTNPHLAQQLARESGAQIVTGLLTHSVTTPDGPAPTYLKMMQYNTDLIVKALK